MMWTAIIPLNAPARRKSRLASAMGARAREALAEELYQHVLGCAERAGIFDPILTLSPPSSPSEQKLWVQQAADLNTELARLRGSLWSPLLVLNADLPLLSPADLLTLVEAAESAGCALAADRHGTGTNATALLPDVPFQFAFGPSSLAMHMRSTPYPDVVLRSGLACDLDTPADIDHLLALGQPLPERVKMIIERSVAESDHAD